jgi:hypothetical protein
MHIAKERVFSVGEIDLFITLHFTLKHAGLLKAVKLLPDSVSRFSELTLQVTQVRTGSRVQEELNKQLNAGFGGNEGI